MKKRKIAKAAVAVLSMLTIGAGCAALTACDGCDDHVHSYGDWTIVGTKPTLDEGGLAERYCEADDGGKETKELPKLTDTSVWTEGTKVDPTCTTDGTRTFTSDYGTVTITVPKDENAHTGGTWTITQDPTLDSKGKATHNCEKEVDIPALSDTKVWTEKTSDYVAATHTTDGKRVYTSVYGTVNVKLPKDENAHTYGKWTFASDDKKPTLEKGGEIQRVCDENAEHIEKQTVAALHDTADWSMKVTTTPTHLITGVAKYTHKEYGVEVEINLPKIAHTFGKWTITTEPKEDAAGEAKRTCTLAGCKDDATATETLTLPELSDSSFWTKSDFAADYNHGSGSTYTNATYELTVNVYTGVKLPAPYDNGTYTSVNVYINNDGTAKVGTSWSAAILSVDENGVGYGEANPFRGKLVFEFVDPDAGRVKVSHYGIKSSSSGGEGDLGEAEYSLRAATEYEEVPTVYYGYVDIETGILVLQYQNSWNDLTVAVPSDVAANGDDFKVSACAGDFIISYKDNFNILVAEERTYFGVSLKDLEGTALSAGTCFDSEEVTVIVRDRAGNVIKGYACSEESGKFVVSDGLEGYYKLDGVTILVNGAGYIYDGKNDGIYEIISNTADSRIIGLVNNNVYYEYTLSGDGLSANGGTYTVATPKVTLTYDLKGETITNDITLSNEISKYIPIQLAVPEHATKQFVGWFIDEACETPVELIEEINLYQPLTDVTLYAKWAVRVEIPLNGLLAADADKATLVLGEGEVISEKLASLYAKFDLNEDNSKYFDGWYTDAEFTRALSDATAADSKESFELYAKWVDVHACYGEYTGRQFRDMVLIANISIDVSGNIVGIIESSSTQQPVVTTLEGKISNYDQTTQVITWIPKSDNGKSYTMWLDKESGLLVIPESLDGNEMNQIPYLLSKSGEIGNFVNIDYAKKIPVNNKTKVVAYDGNKLALLTDDRIYSDVTISDALGKELNLDDIQQSNTLVVTQKGTVVLAVGTTTDKFGSGGKVGELDKFYGIYTKAESNGLGFNGLGSFVWGDKSGTYAKDEDGFELYVIDNGKETEYWRVTLSDKTYNAVQPTAKLHYSGGEYADADVNIKVAFELNAPADKTDKVFNGWHKDPELKDGVITSIIISEDTTIYADWRDKVTVTFRYNLGNGDETVFTTATTGKGMPLEMGDVPTREDGLAFIAWYTDTEYTTVWQSGKTVVEDNTILYARWDLLPWMQKYGTFIINEADGYGTDGIDARGYDFTFTGLGDIVAEIDPYPFSKNNTKIGDYDKEKGTLTITTEGSSGLNDGIHKAFMDVNTGLIVLNDAVGDGNFTKLCVLVPGLISTNNYSSSKYKESYWNDGKSRAVEFVITVDGTETVYAFLVHNNTVYFGTHFVNGEGAVITADKAIEQTSVMLKNDNDDVVSVNVLMTVTVVYGEDFNNETIAVMPGYLSQSDIPKKYKDGKLTTAWYTTSTCDAGTEVDFANLKADASIYAKWETHNFYDIDSYNTHYGTIEDKYPWTETDGVWTSGNKGQSYTNSVLRFTFYADTLFTATYSASCTSSDKNYLEVKNVTENEILEASIATDKTYSSGKVVWTSRQFAFKAGDVVEFTYVRAGIEYKDDIAKIKNLAFEKLDVAIEEKDVQLTYNYNGADIGNEVVTKEAFKVYGELLKVSSRWNGKVVTGWYTADGSDGNWGTLVEDWHLIVKDTVLYAKWEIPHILYGNYKGYNIYTSAKYSRAEDDMSIDVVGAVVGGDLNNKAIALGNDNTFDADGKFGVYDSENGVIAFGGSGTSLPDSMYLYFKTDLTINGVNAYQINSPCVRLVTFMLSNGANMNVFINDTAVYGNVTFSAVNAYNNLITNVSDLADAVAITVYNSEGAVIKAYRKVDSAFTVTELDGLQGTYTSAEGDNLVLNGNSGCTLGTNHGSYTKISDTSITIFIVENGKICTYPVTITGDTYTLGAKQAATVNYYLNGGIVPAATGQLVNGEVPASVKITLPSLIASGKKFAGWYDNAEFTGNVITEVTPVDGQTYNYYAKWEDGTVNAMYGTYKGDYFSGTTAAGNSIGASTSDKSWTVSESGSASGTPSGTLKFNAENNTFIRESSSGWSTSYYFGIFNAEDMIVATDYNKSDKNATSLKGGMYIMVAGLNDGKIVGGSYWNSGRTALVQFKGNDGNPYLVFVFKDKIYGGVSFTSQDGNVAISDVYKANQLSVFDKNGDLINNFKKLNDALVPDDGLGGEYANGSDKILLDANGGIVLNGTTNGNYTIVKGTQEPTIDVYYVDKEGKSISHYNIVLNKSAMTYTATEVNVTINYNMNGHGTQTPSSVFSNVEFTLPTADTVTAEGYVFKGWFDNVECNGTAIIKITPNTETTLYAKWVESVIVTVNYGAESGLGSKSITQAKGEKLTLKDVGAINGKAIDFYYIGTTDNKWTNGSIVDDAITIDVAWKVAHDLYGTYKGIELYSGTSYVDKTVTSLNGSAEVDEIGNIKTTRSTGNLVADTNDSNIYWINGEEYVYYDADAGIIAESWSNGATSGLGNDIYIYFRGDITSIDVSAKLTSSGWTSVLTVNYKDGTKVNVLVYNDKIYSGVTWNEGVSALDTKNAETLTVKDSSGNTIITITGKVATEG